MRKRVFVALLISFLTFAVYIGSAIFASSIEGLQDEYGCSFVTAQSGITLFVAGYGIGPSLSSSSSTSLFPLLSSSPPSFFSPDLH
jgi:DHA1 family multidrug resistance protein-like MFS transporter